MTQDGWYVARDGKRSGPVTFDRLKQLAAAGKVQGDDLVWSDGMEQWVRADAQPELSGISSAATAQAVMPASQSVPQQAVASQAPGAIGYYEPGGGLPPRAAATLAAHARPTGDVGDWPLDDIRVQQFQEAVKIRKKVTGAAQLYRALLLLSVIGLAIFLLAFLFALGASPGGGAAAGMAMLLTALMTAGFCALYFFTWRGTMRSHRWAPLTMFIIFLAAIALNLFGLVIGPSANDPGAMVVVVVVVMLGGLFAVISWISFAAIPRYLAQPGWCQELIVKAGL